jgi:hypothetical protein
MNTTEVTDDLKANFRSWENGCDLDDPELDEMIEDLTKALMHRHPDFSYAEMLKVVREWVGAEEAEPETETSKDITPPPLVKAYNDLETNFRGWLLDHEDQADRLADMLVDRHPGLNKSLALVLARQWVAPE